MKNLSFQAKPGIARYVAQGAIWLTLVARKSGFFGLESGLRMTCKGEFLNRC